MKILKKVNLFLAIAVLGIFMAAGNCLAETLINVESTGNGVLFSVATDITLKSLSVTIDGPNGETAFKQMACEDVVEWLPNDDVPDGIYQFDAVAVTYEEVWSEEESETTQKFGMIRVKDGVMTLEDELKPVGHQSKANNRTKGVAGFFASVANCLLDWLIPSAEAADLTASDSTPEVFFYDTNTGYYEWICKQTIIFLACISGTDPAPLFLYILETPSPQTASFWRAPPVTWVWGLMPRQRGFISRIIVLISGWKTSTARGPGRSTAIALAPISISGTLRQGHILS
jgi:hypothetical protein